MSAEMWSAHLDPCGPNFDSWREILGSTRVPLKSSQSSKAQLGDEADVEIYNLDLAALTLGQRARLLAYLAQKFGCPIYEVETEIGKTGFSIRASEVIVSFGLRALA